MDLTLTDKTTPPSGPGSGAGVSGRARPVTRAGRAEIIGLYRDQRLSLRAVSATTGVSLPRVRSTLGDAGIPVRRPGQQSRISDRQYAAIVAACTAGGMTKAQAAAAAGTSTVAVITALRKHGAVPRPGNGMLTAAQAEAAGVPAREVMVLARYGLVRTVRGTAHGRRLYNAADVTAMAARRSQPRRPSLTPPAT